MRTHHWLTAILLPFIAISAFAQRASHYQRIEIWGLKHQTKEQFARKHMQATGFGLEDACMATLKEKMGYQHPHVMIFPNPEEMNKSMMLITLRDLPEWNRAVPASEHRTMSVPAEWSNLV